MKNEDAIENLESYRDRLAESLANALELRNPTRDRELFELVDKLAEVQKAARGVAEFARRWEENLGREIDSILREKQLLRDLASIASAATGPEVRR